MPGVAEVLTGTLPGSRCVGVRFRPEGRFPEPGAYDLECDQGQDFDWTVEITTAESPDLGYMDSIDVIEGEDDGYRHIRLHGLPDDLAHQGGLARLATREGTGFAPTALFILGQSDTCVSGDVLTIDVEDHDGDDIGSGAVLVPCD